MTGLPYLTSLKWDGVDVRWILMYCIMIFFFLFSYNIIYSTFWSNSWQEINLATFFFPRWELRVCLEWTLPACGLHQKRQPQLVCGLQDRHITLPLLSHPAEEWAAAWVQGLHQTQTSHSHPQRCQTPQGSTYTAQQEDGALLWASAHWHHRCNQVGLWSCEEAVHFGGQAGESVVMHACVSLNDKMVTAVLVITKQTHAKQQVKQNWYPNYITWQLKAVECIVFSEMRLDNVHMKTRWNCSAELFSQRFYLQKALWFIGFSCVSSLGNYTPFNHPYIITCHDYFNKALMNTLKGSGLLPYPSV